MIATTYIVSTPQGAFLAQWDDDEDIPVQYSGSAAGIAYFQQYMMLEMVSGRGGALLDADNLEPAELIGFCQSAKYGIVVLPDDPAPLPGDDDDQPDEPQGNPMQQMMDAVTAAERAALKAEGLQLAGTLEVAGSGFYGALRRLCNIIGELKATPDAMTDAEDEAGEAVPDGRENVVKTAKGSKVVTGFKVVEASRLIVSHDSDGNENPDYPMELQPRDRARATSIAWVKKTAANLDPESLGRTTRADTGAPIIGKDYVVESGNGRTMAIIEAYRTGAAEDYRNWLVEEADYFKVSAERIRAMKRPVLVRVRTSDVDRRAFAVEANQDDKLAMTATEKARADAKRLNDDLASRMGESGDLLAAENNAFLAGFLQSLGDAEAAQYITSNGKPTASLVSRVQAAIFAKAYNDDRLLELTADAAKPEIANVIAALNSAAPTFIRAMDANRIGAEDAAERLVDSVELSLNKQAVEAVIGAINVVRSARDSGMDVSEFVRQQGLFGDTDPSVAAMAVFIANNNRSAKRLGTAFRAMAEYIRTESEHSQTGDMFGGGAPVSLTDVIGAANRALDKEFGEGEFAIGTPGLFDEPPAKSPAAEEKQNSVTTTGQVIVTFGTEYSAESSVIADRNSWMAKNISADQMRTDGDEGIGFTESMQLVYRLNDGRLAYWDMASRSFIEVAASDVKFNAATEGDPQRAADVSLLQSVIDGSADMMDAELAGQLEAIYPRAENDAELMTLFNRAAQAYSDYMVNAARAALG